MRALFSQFSGLIGILTFVNLLLAEAPIERGLLTAIGAGLSVYVVLSLGDLVIQRILEHAAANLPAAEAESTSEEAPAKPEKDETPPAAAPDSETLAA